MDKISSLPEALISHILSFLSTKEAVQTSILSRKWRYLFALVPNLDFDDSVSTRPELLGNNEIHTIFMDFVDRVLTLQGNSTITNFSLKCGNVVYPVCVTRWILNVLERGVSDLDLRADVDSDDMVPPLLFVSNSLVKLRLECAIVHVEDVFLPKLKKLYLHFVIFGDGLTKIISGSRVLEDLVMINISCTDYWNRSVSSKTLKRLTLSCDDQDSNPEIVSFDTPYLVYFEYLDRLAEKYDIGSFDSLVEARIGLRMTRTQLTNARSGDMVGNATELFMRISNVQIMYLFATTLEVLRFCCEPIPVFKNLLHLTIKTHWKIGWESLPALLKNCPNLETLVFEGLHHKDTYKCGDVDGCLCKSSEDTPGYLSSSPVKVVKILKFGEISFYCDDTAKEKQLELVQYFLETMPNLEQMIVCFNIQIDEGVKSRLERLVSRLGLSKCSIQLKCDKTIVPTFPYSAID